MTLKEIIVWLGRKEILVHAALCTARADGSVAQYRAGEQYAILAMVRSEESDVERAITTFLESEGWRDAAIDDWKRLDATFFSEDRRVRACYVSAVTSDGGIIVYSDPADNQIVTGRILRV